jgi:hypothetical protein
VAHVSLHAVGRDPAIYVLIKHFFLKIVIFILNIPAKFGIIIIALKRAEDEGPAAHEKPRRARKGIEFSGIRPFWPQPAIY